MTTAPWIAALAPATLAYLIGSIPFGYLIARGFAGVDIRTMGSGNIGATNVGRVLGFRFFVAVFLLDFAKGYLPTRFLPGAFGAAGPDLPVALAVLAILGHNFPVFLGFRGGKGVATSLGAVGALDWVASLAAATGFGLLLAACRFVSVASLGGGLAWLAVHFARVDDPWGRPRVALSVGAIGLMALLVVRHRANLVRLAAGAEPKVSFRRKGKDAGGATGPPAGPRRAGRVAAPLLIALVALGAAGAMVGGAVLWATSRPTAVAAGPYRVAEVARVATGHQRAERLAFLDDGKLLAATCPRYDRVVLYRVTAAPGLELVADIAVGGRPVAVAAGPDRLYVLARPTNDARHVEEGWWEAFDFRGKSLTPRRRVGLYPDDLALAGPPGSPRLLVLTSGRGEGDPGRPPAALTVYDLDVGSAHPGVMARLDFPGADDLGRLALAPDGRAAAVSVVGPRPAVAWLDLGDLAAPKLVARRAWPESSRPDALRFDADGALLATDEGGDFLWRQPGADAAPTPRDVPGGAGDVAPVGLPGRPDYWAYTLPFESGLAFLPAAAGPGQAHVRLPLLGGRLKLAATRPVGLAVAPTRGLIAVANRSGGSVHLVAMTLVTPR